MGATVRVPRSKDTLLKATGKATIATIQTEENTSLVFFESLAPRPLSASSSETLPSSENEDSKIRPKRRLKRSFLVTPLIRKQGNSDIEQEIEATIDISDIKDLLDFEQENDAVLKGISASSEADNIENIAIMKERGDQLLRLGDPSTSCSYYEMALHISSILQIGSSVIIKEGGHAKVADVDCLDEDGIEVTMGDSEEEKVVQEKDIILCIFHNDNTGMQERVLLNLTRCLLQLAEVAKYQEMASERRPRYLRSAVLAATIAMTIAEHHKDENEARVGTLTSLEQTAFLLRSQAQAALSRFPNAIADMKRLLSCDPHNKEGSKQMQSIQTLMQRQKQVDKKLIKSMCKLVSTATDNSVSSVGGDGLEGEEGSPQGTANAIPFVDGRTEFGAPATTSATVAYNLILYLILPILFAYILQGVVS